ncbi:hypothetical protein K501DRAFT_278720 [Backusella circina FSU 941]|nr:hypothetical protein K501DRAFT_278720 [Backusella circina FSU 941]
MNVTRFVTTILLEVLKPRICHIIGVSIMSKFGISTKCINQNQQNSNCSLNLIINTRSPLLKERVKAIQVINVSYETGINFFDTADMYYNGESEVILSKVLREIKATRSRVVTTTKFYAPVPDDVGSFNFLSALKDPVMVNRRGASMSVASAKANMSDLTAKKYYKTYLEDLNHEIPLP